MCTYVHVLLYCVLFHLYVLCSRKANFYVIHRQEGFCILCSVQLNKVVCQGLIVTGQQSGALGDQPSPEARTSQTECTIPCSLETGRNA